MTGRSFAQLVLLLALVWANTAGARTVVEVHIDMRAEIAAGRFDPVREHVGIRGSLRPLSWGSTRLALDPDGDGIYVTEITFERAPFGEQPVNYKFKIDRRATPEAGWEEGPNHPLQLQRSRQRVARSFGAAAERLPLRRTGRIEQLEPLAAGGVGARAIQVWLPPGYDAEPARRFPVLLLHDGLNVFDAAAAGGEWQVDEAAQRLVEGGALPPFIVVAVAQTADRVDDYTPTASSGRGGGAERYAQYLVRELLPAIDARYRTLGGPAHTAVGGSSLGGLVSMWLICRQPRFFGAALVVSPSVWWDGAAILKELATCPSAPAPRRVWIDVGALEGPSMVGGARRLNDLLKASGGWVTAYHEDPEGSHDEASWAARVEAMLRFLYAPVAR